MEGTVKCTFDEYGYVPYVPNPFMYHISMYHVDNALLTVAHLTYDMLRDNSRYLTVYHFIL